MEGMQPAASPGPAEYDKCHVEGILRVEYFTPDGEFIGMVYGYTKEELAAKLGG